MPERAQRLQIQTGVTMDRMEGLDWKEYRWSCQIFWIEAGSLPSWTPVIRITWQKPLDKYGPLIQSMEGWISGPKQYRFLTMRSPISCQAYRLQSVRRVKWKMLDTKLSFCAFTRNSSNKTAPFPRFWALWNWLLRFWASMSTSFLMWLDMVTGLPTSRATIRWSMLPLMHMFLIIWLVPSCLGAIKLMIWMWLMGSFFSCLFSQNQ